MAVLNSISLESCRLCQQDEGTLHLENNESLLETIFFVTGIKVISDSYEFLPHSICRSCFNKLTDIEIYMKMVQKVDEKLKECHVATIAVPIKDVSGDSQININEKLNHKNCATLDNDYKSHRSVSHTKSFFKCPICMRSFRRKSNYEIHKKTHKELFCQKCNLNFDSELQRNIHVCSEEYLSANGTEINDDDQELVKGIFNSYVCDDCDETFTNEQCLTEHRQKHSTIQQNFICPQSGCSKTFTSSYSLKRHNLIHDGKKPFFCVTCGKNFLTKSSLTCHEKIHLETKSYQCDICNLSFSARSNLRTHVRVYHEGVRFYCSQCTRVFISNCSLKRHEKLHSGIREYKCKECSSEFYTSKELQKHQRYHQGLKPYRCEECFKTFFERHHLTVHQRSHTGERPYVCTIAQCGKSFVDSQKLKRHRKAKHHLVAKEMMIDNQPGNTHFVSTI